MEVRNIPLLQGLSVSELKAIESCLKEKSFQKGELLFTEGAGCDRIFIVRKGRVKLYRMAATGREQILEILEEGETCACNPGSVQWFCSSTAEAVTPCTVWYLSRHDYVQMVRQNAKIAGSLNQIFANRLQCLNALVEEVALKDVKKRIAKFLLDMLSQKGSGAQKGDTLLIPFTREEIAQRLGSSRETVARYLSQLKAEKLIEIKPHQIIIRDKEALQKVLS